MASKTPKCTPDCDPVWLYMYDRDTMKCDDCMGTRAITASDYVLSFGKYEGLNLEELTDEWYLSFLADKGKKDGDGFLLRCLELKYGHTRTRA